MSKLDNYYKQMAINNISELFSCPICSYSAGERDAVIGHIEREHTEQEIKEICSE